MTFSTFPGLVVPCVSSRQHLDDCTKGWRELLGRLERKIHCDEPLTWDDFVRHVPGFHERGVYLFCKRVINRDGGTGLVEPYQVT